MSLRACPTCGKPNATRHCQQHTPRQAHGRKLPERLRRAVLARDGRRCQIAYPGICTRVATHVDHIHPHSKGGTDTLENLQAACGPCNRTKGSSLT